MANTGTITVHTAEVVRYDDPVIITERVAVSALIAGYSDPKRRSYATDLRHRYYERAIPSGEVARNAGYRSVTRPLLAG